MGLVKLGPIRISLFTKTELISFLVLSQGWFLALPLYHQSIKTYKNLVFRLKQCTNGDKSLRYTNFTDYVYDSDSKSISKTLTWQRSPPASSANLIFFFFRTMFSVAGESSLTILCKGKEWRRV